MNICILGAKGFIGSRLAGAFPNAITLGHEQLDLLDAQKVGEYFLNNEFDVIFHCASVGGSRLESDEYNVLYKNLRMFFNVMDATKCKVYYFSSGASTRNDPYGFSKYIIEKYECPRLQILRIWGCFGPGEKPSRFLATLKREGHVTIQVDREFDFFHIDDLIDVIRQTLHKPSQGVLNMIYPGKKYRLSEIARGSCTVVEDALGEAYTGEWNLHGFNLPTLESRIEEYLSSPEP